MRYLVSSVFALALTAFGATAQGSYWEAINDGGYYSDPFEACKKSHESYSANNGLIPNDFSYTTTDNGSMLQVYCKWDDGTPGFWGTSGAAVLRCPTGLKPTDDGDYCGLNKPEDTPCSQSLPAGGNPIGIFSGSKLHREVDFTIGRGRLNFTRYYSSNLFVDDTRLGLRWASNLQPAVKGNYKWWEGYFHFAEPSGRIIRFSRRNGDWKQSGLPWNGAGGWVSFSNNDRKDLPGYELTEVSSTQLTLKSPDGVERDFEFSAAQSSDPIMKVVRYPDGYEITLNYNNDRILTSATDTDGYTISFGYNNLGLLETVTAPDASLYKFEYKELPSGSWIQGVSSAPGNVWRFYSVLSAVVYPDDTPGTDTDNPRKEYNYDHVSNYTALTSIKDERDILIKTWEYAWGNTGWRATSSQGPNGTELTTITETVDREEFKVTNALGKETDYEFSYAHKIPVLKKIDGVASANCAAATKTISYDSLGRITNTTDREGQQLKKTLDSGSGLPTSITAGYGTPEAETTTLAWDTALRKPTLIERPGLKGEFTYDADWNLTQFTQTDTTSHSAPYTTNGQTRTWMYSWGADGLLLSVDGPVASDTVSFTYDSNNNLASVTNEHGHTTTINSVDGMGRPTQLTDANGVTTTVTYTPRGWADSIATSSGGVTRTTSLTYDQAGNITQIDRPDGSWLSYTYNDSSWLTQVTTSAGDQISYQHNLLGNVTRTDFETSGGSLAHISMTYDELGRVRQILGGAGDVRNFAYDRSDRVTTLTDGLGRNWLTAFDALDRVISETDPELDSVQYDWSSAGGLDTFTDGRSLSTSYVRNGFGEVIRTVSPDTGITDYWYDMGGRLTRRLDAAGDDVSFTYDSGGRRLAETYANDTALNTTYSYDSTAGGNAGKGQLTGVSSAAASYQFVFNGFGDLTSQTQTIGAQSYATTYTLASSGRLAQMVMPSGRLLDYTYDVDGRVTGISTRANSGATSQSIVTGASYAPFGPITSYGFGNGTSAQYGFDASYMPVSLTVSDGATTVLSKVYQYDANNRTIGILDLYDNAATTSYHYHDDGRLERAIGPWGEYEWTYDAVGNRLTEDRYAIGGALLSEETYNYSSADNRLLSISDATPAVTRTLSYTADGNLDLDSRASGLDYNYGEHGRLTEVKTGGTLEVSYSYDAFQQRVTRTTAGSGTVSHFVFDPSGFLLGEYDGATGSVVAEYIWFAGRLVASVDNAGVISYVQTGHLGQPLLVMDGSASAIWRGETTPFGTYVYTSGAGSDPDLHFPGQWLEAGSGLYQNWHRDYDPSLGRYIEADPLGLAAGQSLYGYVGQDPLNKVDPEGLFMDTNGQYTGTTRRGSGLRGAGLVGGAFVAADAWKSAYDMYKSPFDKLSEVHEGQSDTQLEEKLENKCTLADGFGSGGGSGMSFPPNDDDDPCTYRYEKEWDRCNTIAVSGPDATRWRLNCKARAADRLSWCQKGIPDLQPEWPGSY